MTATLLELKDYSITFRTPEGEVAAVSKLNLKIGRGERVAVVGESGSGKSQTFLGLMGLLAKNGRTSGQALLDDRKRVRRERLTSLLERLTAEEKSALWLSARVAIPVLGRLVANADSPPEGVAATVEARPVDQRKVLE